MKISSKMKGTCSEISFFVGRQLRICPPNLPRTSLQRLTSVSWTSTNGWMTWTVRRRRRRRPNCSMVSVFCQKLRVLLEHCVHEVCIVGIQFGVQAWCFTLQVWASRNRCSEHKSSTSAEAGACVLPWRELCSSSLRCCFLTSRQTTWISTRVCGWSKS